MNREKYVIITAGGAGSRMGADIPKQILEIGGKPILSYTENYREKLILIMHQNLLVHHMDKV